jgi:hypothetical protein
MAEPPRRKERQEKINPLASLAPSRFKIFYSPTCRGLVEIGVQPHYFTKDVLATCSVSSNDTRKTSAET